jgi:hypothetical protein
MASFSEWSRIDRVVEDARAGLHGALQQPGGGDVFEVEGRVLAHQHRVEGGEGQGLLGAGDVPGVVEVGVRAWQRADTVPASQISASRWMAKISWPRRAAARIMAMLESL